MAVRIRLTRQGRKKRPFYRVIVTDSRKPRDGRYIECVGTYNPLNDPPDVTLQEDRINYWIDQGAQPSFTVRSLLRKQGMLFKRALAKKGLDDAAVTEELKKWEVLQIEKKRNAELKKEMKKKAKAEAKKKKDEEEAPSAPAPASEPAPEAAAEPSASAEPAEKEEVKEKASAEEAAAEGSGEKTADADDAPAEAPETENADKTESKTEEEKTGDSVEGEEKDSKE